MHPLAPALGVEVQRAVHDLELAVEAILPAFNRYDGAQAVGLGPVKPQRLNDHSGHLEPTGREGIADQQVRPYRGPVISRSAFAPTVFGSAPPECSSSSLYRKAFQGATMAEV